MRITEATENYMEAILILGQQNGSVRAVDIANYMGFSKPTISQYMKQYVQQGLVSIASDGHITLTEEGMKVAQSTLEKHQVISAIFIAMGVNKDVALEDACKVEHDLSDETFRCMKNYYFKHIRGGA